MFAYISGILTQKSPTRVTIEANGLGYDISIPVSTYERLSQQGEQVRLLTYLYVREDIMQLYGFATLEEKELFTHLISVSGVGPRMAQGVLSKLSTRSFADAVHQENIGLLTQVPGVGKKMAQRMTIELKDKLAGGKSEGVEIPAVRGIGTEAVAALVSLGYREAEAQKMVVGVMGSNGEEIPLEDVVKRALQTTG